MLDKNNLKANKLPITKCKFGVLHAALEKGAGKQRREYEFSGVYDSFGRVETRFGRYDLHYCRE